MVGLFLKWMLAANWGLVDATLLTFNIEPANWLGDPFRARSASSWPTRGSWIFTSLIMIEHYVALKRLDR